MKNREASTEMKKIQEVTEMENRQNVSASRIGDQTPEEKFTTFPLADSTIVQEVSEEAIPTSDDVVFVKEFVDENEK